MGEYELRSRRIDAAETIALYALSMKDFVAFYKWASKVAVMRECLEKFMEDNVVGGSYA